MAFVQEDSCPCETDVAITACGVPGHIVRATIVRWLGGSCYRRAQQMR